MDKDRKIFLIRHLKTKFNENGINMGRVLDSGILKRKKDIEDFKYRLKLCRQHSKITPNQTILLSSPLRRCFETAAVIKKELKLTSEIRILEEIIETDMGRFSAKNATQIRKQFGNLVDRWMFNPEVFKFPDGESYKEVRKRVRIALGKLEGEFQSPRFIFIITHVDIIKMLFSEILGISFNTRRNLIIPNGSISIIEKSKEDKFSIEGVNVYP